MSYLLQRKNLSHLYPYLFPLLIIIVGFLLRLNAFQFPYYHYMVDYNRDYLIANHIVTYHEIALKGPDGQFGDKESPLYYYLLATFLIIKNDIVFLGFGNLLLQTATLVIIYLLAKNLFGTTTAIVATILFGLSSNIVLQSGYVWQPHIMQPFINLCYLFLVLAYIKKKYSLLLGSVVLYVVSFALHNSVLAVLPAFLIGIIAILKIQRKSWLHYLGTLLVFLLTLIVLYIPVITTLPKTEITYALLLSATKPLVTIDLSTFSQNFISRAGMLITYLFSDFLKILPLLSINVFLLILTVYTLIFKRKSPSTKILAMLILTILSALVIAATLTLAQGIDFPIRYFSPIFGLAIISTAALLANLLPSSLFIKNTFVLFTLVLLLFLNWGTTIETFFSIKITRANFFTVSYKASPATNVLEKEIIDLKNEQNYDSWDFFQFRTFSLTQRDVWSEDLFWPQLEKNFQTKLTFLDPDSYRGYTPIGQPQVIFLQCNQVTKSANDQEICIKSFQNEYSDYKVIKRIFSNGSFSLYTTKRNE